LRLRASVGGRALNGLLSVALMDALLPEHRLNARHAPSMNAPRHPRRPAYHGQDPLERDPEIAKMLRGSMLGIISGVASSFPTKPACYSNPVRVHGPWLTLDADAALLQARVHVLATAHGWPWWRPYTLRRPLCCADGRIQMIEAPSGAAAALLRREIAAFHVER